MSKVRKWVSYMGLFLIIMSAPVYFSKFQNWTLLFVILGVLLSVASWVRAPLVHKKIRGGAVLNINKPTSKKIRGEEDNHE